MGNKPSAPPTAAAFSRGAPDASWVRDSADARTVVIVNPNSGGKRGRRLFDTQVRPALEAAGLAVEAHETTHAGHAGELAETLDLAGVRCLCALGGDGTVHEVANGLLRRSGEIPPVALLPAGTGNTLAWSLGIGDLAAGVAAVVGGAVGVLDAVEVAGVDAADATPIYSLNMVGFGLPAAVMHRANRMRFMGGAQYNLAAKLEVVGNRGYDVVIELPDGQPRVEGRYAMVQSQLNAHMGEKMPFCPDAKVDDGLIDLVLIKSGSRAAMIKIMGLAATGRHIGHPDVESYQVSEYTLRPAAEADAGPLTVNVDGELIGGTPCRVRCMPGALSVLVPLSGDVVSGSAGAAAEE